MRPWKLALCGTLAAALAIMPLSSASADWYYHGPYNNYGPYNYYGPPPFPLGVVGAVLGGAAAIATAPLAIFGAWPPYYGGYYNGGYYNGGYYSGGYYGGGYYDGPDYGYAPDVYGGSGYDDCPPYPTPYGPY